MKLTEDIPYAARKGCALDVWLPDAPDGTAFVYFHGGGLEGGSRKDASPLAQSLAARGTAVISADYRMYPDAAYPDFILDAADAVRWALAHAAEYGFQKLFVGGSSAGGYLSMMLCFDKRYLGADADKITGYVFDAGQPTTHFNVLRERGLDTRRVIIDEAAPLYHIEAGRNYPPMLVFVAENDISNRYEQTQLLLSTLRDFGYAPDLATCRFMKGWSHCAYDGEAVFYDEIGAFIQKIAGAR